MPFGEKISTEVDGVVVKGWAKISSPADLDVKIRSPFQWLQGSRHLRSYLRLTRPFAGDQGIIEAKKMLAALYNLGCFLSDNMEDLQAAYAACGERKRVLAEKLKLNGVAKERSGLKERFLSGEINQTDYQHELGLLWERKEYFADGVRNIENEFFRTHFSEASGRVSRKQILQVLDNPDLLYFGTDHNPKQKGKEI